MSNNNIIFFTGSHRTGSKSLANFFDENLISATSVHQRTSQQFLNLISNAKIAGYVPEIIFRRLVSLLLLSWIRKQHSQYVIETNGFNLFSLEYALEQFEKAKIIHVVRDPRTFIRSLINYRRHSDYRRYLQRNLPFWELKAHYAGRTSRSDWNRLSEAEQIAWQWQIKNKYILDNFSSRDNYRLIRYEDLYDRDSGCFQELLEFIGVAELVKDSDSFFSNKVHASMMNTFPVWQQWDKGLCRNINAICGDLMTYFGYGAEEEWLALLD